MLGLPIKDHIRTGTIPLITLEDAAQGLAFIQNLHHSTQASCIQVTESNINLFALTIEDQALTPRFYPGYIAIIDSSRTAVTNDYVLVYFPETTTTVLRRLIMQPQGAALCSHNRDYEMISLGTKNAEDYVILGVVVNTIMEYSTAQEETNYAFYPELFKALFAKAA